MDLKKLGFHKKNGNKPNFNEIEDMKVYHKNDKFINFNDVKPYIELIRTISIINKSKVPTKRIT